MRFESPTLSLTNEQFGISSDHTAAGRTVRARRCVWQKAKRNGAEFSFKRERQRVSPFRLSIMKDLEGLPTAVGLNSFRPPLKQLMERGPSVEKPRITSKKKLAPALLAPSLPSEAIGSKGAAQASRGPPILADEIGAEPLGSSVAGEQEPPRGIAKALPKHRGKREAFPAGRPEDSIASVLMPSVFV